MQFMQQINIVIERAFSSADFIEISSDPAVRVATTNESSSSNEKSTYIVRSTCGAFRSLSCQDFVLENSPLFIREIKFEIVSRERSAAYESLLSNHYIEALDTDCLAVPNFEFIWSSLSSAGNFEFTGSGILQSLHELYADVSMPW